MSQFPRRVNTSPDPRFYAELAKQDLTFEQTVAELIDNAISADGKNLEIHLKQVNDVLEILVADDGFGIGLNDIVEKILRMGGSGRNPGAMNEHGFGLKNSLSRLTEGTRDFFILTRDAEARKTNHLYILKGPLSPDMMVDLARPPETSRWTENVSHLGLETGTRVYAESSVTFLNTTLPPRRGRPFRRIDIEHIDDLCEHLGVFYRPFLDASHRIFLKWWDDDVRKWQEREIRALPVPYGGGTRNERILITHNGRTYDVFYKWGKLDQSLASRRHKVYYQSNTQTQGVDIKVRKRVILPHQLTEIFGLQRHNSMNEFVGELDLDDPIFSTVNNKTKLDVNNPVIEKLIEEMSTRHLPPHDARALVFGESELRRRIARTLEAASPGAIVQELATVWSRVGVEIDILQTVGRRTLIYEVKNRELAPLDVYQIIMYWDALVADGSRAFEAKLVSTEDLTSKLRNLVRYWNRRKDAGGRNYRIGFIRSDQLIAATPSTKKRQTRNSFLG